MKKNIEVYTEWKPIVPWWIRFLLTLLVCFSALAVGLGISWLLDMSGLPEEWTALIGVGIFISLPLACMILGLPLTATKVVVVPGYLKCILIFRRAYFREIKTNGAVTKKTNLSKHFLVITLGNGRNKIMARYYQKNNAKASIHELIDLAKAQFEPG
jgi:hypothetical protein